MLKKIPTFAQGELASRSDASEKGCVESYCYSDLNRDAQQGPDPSSLCVYPFHHSNVFYNAPKRCAVRLGTSFRPERPFDFAPEDLRPRGPKRAAWLGADKGGPFASGSTLWGEGKWLGGPLTSRSDASPGRVPPVGEGGLPLSLSFRRPRGPKVRKQRKRSGAGVFKIYQQRPTN